MSQTKVLVLLGSTASGKSRLAMALGKKYPEIEIISADSMQVYRGMDIGTAKPTLQERKQVAHHCIDLVEPTELFETKSFADMARRSIADITERGGQPLVVGGTGLYIRALVDNLNIPGQFPEIKAELSAEPSTQKLWERLNKLDTAAADKMMPGNRRRIIRALEVTVGSGKPFSSYGPGMRDYPEDSAKDTKSEISFRQVGIRLSRKTIDERIAHRYKEQMKRGFLNEAARLHKMDLSRTAKQALGYKELFAHLSGEMDLETALSEAERRTRKFARRQERWFRRDPRISWMDAELEPEEVFEELESCFVGNPNNLDRSRSI